MIELLKNGLSQEKKSLIKKRIKKTGKVVSLALKNRLLMEQIKEYDYLKTIHDSIKKLLE